MIEIKDLKFDEQGLIPTVITDAKTKEVLMVAYMNKETLQKSIEKRLTCFWSRSRNEEWAKGQTSGNYQHIVSIKTDCDKDTLLIAVNPDGPACHLGTTSCFEEELFVEESPEAFSYEKLFELIKDRQTNKKEGSYTSYLFDKGLDKILKKIGEESTEVVVAAKSQDKRETIYEIADLIYHTMVLMAYADISVEDINNELASRHVIDTKVKQEKMV
ncbi:MAG: bifunctional phosphoribosyl-AMP cyclohydrolase/phosphoribosyl-ATP diphosphatase HisIE [Eggerthellaceae bacterium]|nr:bifunctional phosphoribosyl-AMP cyclohydrolase/phosphoribosyl-ATP diphosphatase HisIE [Eggerthellaceae bacterium]